MGKYKKYKIQYHSACKKEPFYYEAVGTNVYSITDKLVRETAEMTIHFAGDIVYDIMTLLEAVQHGSPYDKLLCFGDDGVKTVDVSKEFVDGNLLEYADGSKIDVTDIYRAWRLTYEPNEHEEMGKTTLRRVSVGWENFN